jgi:glycosyltransferase involved in cell wall biosynthesis
LPVWNAEATLQACLDSLSAQSLTDFELIAVDDGSSDNSRELLFAHARRDGRLRVVAEPHRGLVPALNEALARAQSRLVARMDADDLAHPDRLALQARRLETDNVVDMLGCGVRVTGGARNAGLLAYAAWSNRLLTHEDIVRDLFVESPLVHPSLMTRREAFESLGGYRHDGGPEDYDLLLRAHGRGMRFAKLPEVLLDWHDSENRLTRSDPRYHSDRFRKRKIEALLDGPLQPGRPVVIWGAGPIGKAWAKDLLARGVALRAFIDVHPRRVGQRIQGVLVGDVASAAAHAGVLHLIALGQPGARERARQVARGLGLRECSDHIAVA